MIGAQLEERRSPRRLVDAASGRLGGGLEDRVDDLSCQSKLTGSTST
jgi:hypothetical protein